MTVPQEGLIEELRLSHLFLWTSLCAVDMALYRLAYLTGETGPRNSALSFTYALLLSIARGAALTGAALWIARRIKQPSYTLQPGEWLLVVSGCRALFLTALAAIWRSPGSMALGFLLTCWIYAVPALRAQAPRRWRAFYWLAVVMELRRLVDPMILSGVRTLPFYAAWNIGWELLMTVSLVLVAIADYRSGVRWPFSHWLGVAAWLWGRSVSIIMYAVLALGVR